eukprot:gb/GECG01004400.1/.p1 GENE.gb/GECG01004400.1/~~gb/GECG01004400.1/.p1  ORF type:complete len:257 (+),score=33.99 gb/GECG01004400.1/:1-771(+)
MSREKGRTAVHCALLPSRNLKYEYNKQSRFKGSTRPNECPSAFCTEAPDDAPPPEPSEEEIRRLETQLNSESSNGAGTGRTRNRGLNGNELLEASVCLDDDLFNLIYPLEDWSSFDFNRAMELGRDHRQGTGKGFDSSYRVLERSSFLRNGRDNYDTAQLRGAWKSRLRATYLYRALGSDASPWRAERLNERGKGSSYGDQRNAVVDKTLPSSFPKVSARTYQLEAREWLQRELSERRLIASQRIVGDIASLTSLF